MPNTPSKSNRGESPANQYPCSRSAILAFLDAQQRKQPNWLTNQAIKETSRYFSASLAEVYGVATYYSMMATKPVGKYHLQMDTCVPGFLSGADEIFRHLQNRLGIVAGETTKDGLFTLSAVQDLASAGTGPVMQVNDGVYFENLTPGRVDGILENLRKGELPVADQNGFFKSDCQVLLRNRSNPKAVELAEYQKSGGYAALAKVLEVKPEEVIALVKDAQLRGRGGAGFSTGVKWGFLPKENTGPVYMICNADEGEPGTFKDRQIMQYDPHLVVEGVAIAAHAIKAKQAFIYIRGEFGWIANILEQAIEQAKAAGFLQHVDIVVHRGAGSYVCGDETALIESLEGKRGNPRVKPPFPAIKGLYGCPTIVNNVETLACLPFIVNQGAAAFRAIGTQGNAGPKIYQVSGHVNQPGVFEYPMGTDLETVLKAAGGVKGKLKGVIVGGLSVPILTASECVGLKLDFDSCLKAGTMLGSGGIMVINDTTSIPALALRTIMFYAHESCGQCVPCWRGSHVIKKLLTRLVEGQGQRQDIDTMLALCQNIKGATICPMGEAFTMPIQAMLTKFRPEFEALVK